MILRHLTTIDKVPSIVKDGFLKGSNNMRITHKDHVSFELFNPEKDKNAFIKAYSLAKGVSIDNVVELFFDAEMMRNAGIEIRDSFINGVKDSKIELTLYPEVTKDDYESIGEYHFVYRNVSLEFLTAKSKQDIQKWKECFD